jgi:hypothetical protein
MNNIFGKNIVPNHYFNFNMSFDIKSNLYYYLMSNLEDENYYILKWDLANALKTNANGKYIY